MLTETNRDVLTRLIGQKALVLYALYDAAQDNTLLADLQRTDITHDCLFAGYKAITLRNVAPYLVSCADFHGNAQDFLETIWQRGVSMLVEAAAPAEQVRLQLKKNAYVKNSDGIQCYFRYYDARAFSRFMRAATNAQLCHLFGNAICTIYWHDTTTDAIASLSRKTPGLIGRLFDPGNAHFDIQTLS
ncbi:MAG: DUF4123 domain-containing protein [Pseudomonadota bacterium]